MITLITFILAMIGGLNWFLVGAFRFDLVAAIFGAATTVGSRIVYILVGISAIWLIIQAIRSSGKLALMNDAYNTDSLLSPRTSTRKVD